MMIRPEEYIRFKIRQLLAEARLPVSTMKTSRIGGGVRQEFRDLKEKSKTRPRQLMDDLGVSALKSSDGKHEVLHDLLDQAIAGNEIMATAYSKPEYVKDKFGRKAAIIKVVGDIKSRDGVFFIRHTVRGAKNANLMPFKDKIAIELLGDDVVVYVAKTPYSWNTSPEGAPAPQKEKEEPEKEK